MNLDIERLKGQFVYLELLKPDHKEIIRPLANDERIWEYTRALPSGDSFDTKFNEYFDHALDSKALEGQHAFVIKRVKDQAIIGMTRFYEYHEKDKRAEIGYTWYIPSVWGKVYNKECKLLLLQYAFETLGLNRVQFKVAHQNIRSQKAVEKIGALKEGVLRKFSYRNDGTTRDAVIFSIINDEWPDKKEKLRLLVAESEND
jgi:RimJ/RimL family protein N-acetyltransferase